MTEDPVAYRVASGTKLAAWCGARYAGETGIDVVEGFIVQTVFEIPSVPDFSSERFPDLARLDEAQRISAIADKQAQFLSAPVSYTHLTLPTILRV